jgi:hypothetical protein
MVSARKLVTLTSACTPATLTAGSFAQAQPRHDPAPVPRAQRP